MDSLTSMASSGLEGSLPRFPPHSVLLCLFLSLWGISSGGSPCHGVVRDHHTSYRRDSRGRMWKPWAHERAYRRWHSITLLRLIGQSYDGAHPDSREWSPRCKVTAQSRGREVLLHRLWKIHSASVGRVSELFEHILPTSTVAIITRGA